jgi:hypothetical protein
MADGRRFEIDELVVRPGTYFNPQTEVMVVVDDSPSLDTGIFNMEDFEGADWVLISDDTPIDDAHRDEMLESFQATYSSTDGGEDGAEEEEELEDLDGDPEALEDLEER